MTTWSQDAATHLRAVHDGLGEARAALSRAASGDWSSVAAELYRSELADHVARIDEVLARRDVTRLLVLEHTNAADACTVAGAPCP